MAWLWWRKGLSDLRWIVRGIVKGIPWGIGGGEVRLDRFFIDPKRKTQDVWELVVDCVIEL
jgi:hypothetical protein